MNNIVLAGRLTQEPELKTTNTGTEVTSFSLAVGRDYARQGEERQTDFINCVAWRKTAAFICTYFHKGDGIVLNGRLEGRRYVDKDGNNRTAYEVVVERVEFPLSIKQIGQQTILTSTTAPNTTVSQEMPLDDDLPF